MNKKDKFFMLLALSCLPLSEMLQNKWMVWLYLL